MSSTNKMTPSQKRKAQSARSLFTQENVDCFLKHGWNLHFTDKGRMVISN